MSNASANRVEDPAVLAGAMDLDRDLWGRVGTHDECTGSVNAGFPEGDRQRPTRHRCPRRRLRFQRPPPTVSRLGG